MRGRCPCCGWCEEQNRFLAEAPVSHTLTWSGEEDTPPKHIPDRAHVASLCFGVGGEKKHPQVYSPCDNGFEQRSSFDNSRHSNLSSQKAFAKPGVLRSEHQGQRVHCRHLLVLRELNFMGKLRPRGDIQPLVRCTPRSMEDSDHRGLSAQKKT
jgi:hypothetical protein